MTAKLRPAGPLAALCLALAAAGQAGGEGQGVSPDPFAFLPEGGRGLFARAFPEPDAARAALSESRDAAGWQAALEGRPGLSGVGTETLANYLSLVAPLPGAAGADDPAALLPPDGRALAVERCQACHSLFSGYLMQRRDAEGWRAIFKSPFHSDIAMTPEELALFAGYSALNMPLKYDDVPPELRF